MAVLKADQIYLKKQISQLVEEFEKDGFESATALYLPNIFLLCNEKSEARDELNVLLNSDDLQTSAFSRFIKKLPIRPDTVQAMLLVDRRAFVVETFSRFWFIDYPLPSINRSWISSPSIVSIMCNNVPETSFECVHEIGSGCGYHLSVIQMLPHLVDSTIVGYEIDSDMVWHSNSLLGERQKLAKRGTLNVVNGDGLASVGLPNCFTYMTCAVSTQQLTSLQSKLGKGSILQVPRPITDRDLGSLGTPNGAKTLLLDQSNNGEISILSNVSAASDEAFFGPVTFVPCFGSGFKNKIHERSNLLEWLMDF